MVSKFGDFKDSSIENVYESHVSVDCSGLEDWRNFKEVCQEIGVKGIQIQLPQGEYPTHLMTSSWHKGDFEEVKEEVYNIGNLLREKGFPPVRHKIEAMIRNELVPQTTLEAQSRPEEQYFEFHVKVSREEDQDIGLLKEICDLHGAHLSKSASTRIGSSEQRFITSRYRLGLDSAIEKFDFMLEDFERSGFSVFNKLREYVIYDDNFRYDKGWAEISPCSSCTEYDKCLFLEN